MAGRAAPLVRGRLLDAGCGKQPFRPWYGPLAERCVAVDLAPLDGLDARGRLDALPFRSATFDVVLATEVLEHVDDAEPATAELFRVLAPGGHALVTVPFLYPTHEAPFDYRRLTHFGLADLLRRHGFEDVAVWSRGGPGALVAHAAVLAVVAAGDAAGRRLGGHRPWERRWLRRAVATPQLLVINAGRRHRRVRGVEGLAGMVSLGYLAVARKPLGVPSG